MFKSKVVIVTGSSTGFGAAAAVKFAQEGAAGVTIHGRKEDALKAVREKIEKVGNGQTKVHVVVGDISDQKVRERLVKETVDKFGQLDVLVNNAGFMNNPQPTSETPIDIFDKLFDVNLRSVVVLTQLAIPHLIKTKGNIVNISSLSAIRAVPTNAYYGMSKIAIDHYSRCLAVELGPKGVRVNSINPGFIPDTSLATNRGANAEEIKARSGGVAQVTPLRRTGKTDEVVELIVFLASDKAAFITGTGSLVDGGLALF